MATGETKGEKESEGSHYLLHAPHIFIAHTPAFIAEHIFLEADSIGTKVELPMPVSDHAVIPSYSNWVRGRLALFIVPMGGLAHVKFPADGQPLLEVELLPIRLWRNTSLSVQCPSRWVVREVANIPCVGIFQNVQIKGLSNRRYLGNLYAIGMRPKKPTPIAKKEPLTRSHHGAKVITMKSIAMIPMVKRVRSGSRHS